MPSFKCLVYEFFEELNIFKDTASFYKYQYLGPTIVELANKFTGTNKPAPIDESIFEHPYALNLFLHLYISSFYLEKIFLNPIYTFSPFFGVNDDNLVDIYSVNINTNSFFNYKKYLDGLVNGPPSDTKSIGRVPTVSSSVFIPQKELDWIYVEINELENLFNNNNIITTAYEPLDFVKYNDRLLDISLILAKANFKKLINQYQFLF